MSNSPARSRDNRAAVAAQFGISAKTLRHYEKLGMLSPARSEAGWRCYGKPETDRLRMILSLKQLGLPLADIAKLLDGSPVDLKTLLSAQETTLLEHRAATDHALNLIRMARTRLEKGEAIGTPDLADLVQKISLVLVKATPEIEALMVRIFTPEQLDRLRQRHDDETLAKTAEGWSEIHADIDRVIDGPGPNSPEGLEIARRAVSLIRVHTRGDKDLWNAYARFMMAGMGDSKIARQISAKPSHWNFLQAAMTELRQRGELQP